MIVVLLGKFLMSDCKGKPKSLITQYLLDRISSRTTLDIMEIQPLQGISPIYSDFDLSFCSTCGEITTKSENDCCIVERILDK